MCGGVTFWIRAWFNTPVLIFEFGTNTWCEIVTRTWHPNSDLVAAFKYEDNNRSVVPLLPISSRGNRFT